MVLKILVLGQAQQCGGIKPFSGKPTTIPNLKSFNIKKTMTYGAEIPGPGIWNKNKTNTQHNMCWTPV
jgi:hypothetical protein